MYVNLEALYPSIDGPVTELSFEELMAGHRGWLDKIWKQEASHEPNKSTGVKDNTTESNLSPGTLSEEVSEMADIVRDAAVMDEHGVAKEQNREGKGRKMKIKEVNETQISKWRFTDPFGEAYRK